MLKVKTADPGIRLLGRVIFDPWVAMLVTGALGHRLHEPWLYRLDYWSWVLIVIGIQALWGTEYTDFNIVKVKEKK